MPRFLYLGNVAFLLALLEISLIAYIDVPIKRQKAMAKTTKKNSKPGKGAIKTNLGKAAKAIKPAKTGSSTKVLAAAKPAQVANDKASVHNYIIGYGSLIEFASRTRTAKDALYVRPVQVNGFVRGWFAQVSAAGYSPTYVGAVSVSDLKARPVYPYLNAVVYYVTEAELQATDQREDAGYTRVEVLPSQIQMLDGGGAVPEGKYWIYLNKFQGKNKLENHLPSANFPIVQSYVDICINGCFEIEANFPQSAGFAEMFIKTTLFWSNFWVNDRPMPRRPFMDRPNAYTIDALLAATIPDYFSQMRIEPASWEQGPEL